MDSTFDYHSIGQEIRPFIAQASLYGNLTAAGIVITSLGSLALIGHSIVYLEKEENKYTTKDYVKLAAGVVVIALIVFGTALSHARYVYSQGKVNEYISKAVTAENGVFTKAKEIFLKQFGRYCTKLLGEEACYLTQQLELMKYMPTAIFYNIELGVWQFVNPAYIPRRR